MNSHFNFGWQKITTDDIEDFFKKIAQNNPMEYLSKMICPNLVGTGWKNVRKSTLLMLVTQEQNANQRTRLHILLKGSAGTGKTVFLSWVKDNLQGIMVNAELTSKTGLVGDARGKKISSGLLHSYDGNIVGIDELDKMPARDQNGLLQAMEEGSYMIVKGNHRQRFKSEIRAIGSTNEMKKIIRPLRDRFDFHFECVMSTRRERSKQTKKIVDSFFKKREEEYAKVLRAYLLWLDGFNPEPADDENYNDAVKRLSNYIKLTETKIDGLSYRSLELSILRLTWALAKIHRRNILSDDIHEAIMFKDQLLKSDTTAEYVFYKGKQILDIAKHLAEQEYGERFSTLDDKGKQDVLKKRQDLLQQAKQIYAEQKKQNFTELDRLRKELSESDAFDKYLKEKELERVEEVDTNTEEGLELDNIKKEEQPKDEESIYNVKKTDRPLTLDEAEKLAQCFTVKDLHKIFGNFDCSRAEIIMKMSEKGLLPAPPIRKYICKNCGAKVVIDEYWSPPFSSPWGRRLCKKCFKDKYPDKREKNE